MTEPSIAALFDNYFSVIPADTEELIKKVYNIRHQVYCEELGYEAQRANHLEFDDYDLRSIHCLLFHKPSQTHAGCIRLILADNYDPSAKFPLEHVCNDKINWDLNGPAGDARRKYGEISRLAITANFRRRRGESKFPDGGSEAIDDPDMDERRRFPSVALGLYVAITAMGLNQGLDGVFAMMEPRLARQLRRFGFLFDQAGDTVEHRGIRAPFYISRENLFNNLKPEFMELLQNIQNQLGVTSQQAAPQK
jgi:N-acyl amino acid synthase of PEP-CTERM/exosortase system